MRGHLPLVMTTKHVSIHWQMSLGGKIISSQEPLVEIPKLFCQIHEKILDSRWYEILNWPMAQTEWFLGLYPVKLFVHMCKDWFIPKQRHYLNVQNDNWTLQTTFILLRKCIFIYVSFGQRTWDEENLNWSYSSVLDTLGLFPHTCIHIHLYIFLLPIPQFSFPSLPEEVYPNVFNTHPLVLLWMCTSVSMFFSFKQSPTITYP
jgi:hypothetical protein